MVTARSAVVERVADVLDGHPVEFAMLFGSAARGDGADRGDVDLAVEFTDDAVESGYSDACLALAADLEDSLGEDVDVVTFASMSPVFHSVVLEEGVLVVGTVAGRAELERRFRRDAPSAEDARARLGRGEPTGRRRHLIVPLNDMVPNDDLPPDRENRIVDAV